MFSKGTSPYFLLVVLLFTLSQGVQHADSSNKDLRLVVVSNGVAILPCDSRSPLAPRYAWSKDGLPLAVLQEGGRVQLTAESHLLIKDAREEDSGLYVCRAMDGEDTLQEVNVTLIVLVSDSAPYFFNFTQPNETIQRTEGSSVKFQCPARGHPTPGITWLKNSIHIDTSELDTTAEYMEWSITLKDLKPSDSGNYTCFIANELGSVNATFYLQVNEKEKTSLNTTRPDLSVFHPLNTTVKYGSSATFQCRVRSEAPPNIQWLKKIDDSELPKYQKQHHEIIKVQGENYRVLQSLEVVERSDGSFLNKLTIPEVYEADSGKYICLGANSMGYSFRSAYLTVLPRPRALPLGWSRSVAVHPGHPSSLLVAIPITLGVVVGVMVALVVLCHRRRLDTAVPLPASGYRREAEPRVEEEPEEDAFLSRLHSEVELEGSGSVVTKICVEQGSSSNYDSCFVMRNDV